MRYMVPGSPKRKGGAYVQYESFMYLWFVCGSLCSTNQTLYISLGTISLWNCIDMELKKLLMKDICL
jgi:hypothetical protein